MRKSGYRTVFHIYLIFLLAMLGAILAASGLLVPADHRPQAGRLLCEERLAANLCRGVPGGDYV